MASLVQGVNEGCKVGRDGGWGPVIVDNLVDTLVRGGGASWRIMAESAAGLQRGLLPRAASSQVGEFLGGGRKGRGRCRGLVVSVLIDADSDKSVGGLGRSESLPKELGRKEGNQCQDEAARGRSRGRNVVGRVDETGRRRAGQTAGGFRRRWPRLGRCLRTGNEGMTPSVARSLEEE